jgi:hypothetical protein
LCGERNAQLAFRQIAAVMYRAVEPLGKWR